MPDFSSPYNPFSAGGGKRDKAEDVLVVRLDERQWAVTAAYVAETFYLDNLTAVPLMAPIVEGLTNLRGEVVPVLNIAALSSSPRNTPVVRERRCVLLKAGDMKLALIVDEIVRIGRVRPMEREAFKGRICRWLFTYDSHETYLLDVDSLVEVARREIRSHLKSHGLLPAHEEEKES